MHRGGVLHPQAVPAVTSCPMSPGQEVHADHGGPDPSAGRVRHQREEAALLHVEHGQAWGACRGCVGAIKHLVGFRGKAALLLCLCPQMLALVLPKLTLLCRSQGALRSQQSWSRVRLGGQELPSTPPSLNCLLCPTGNTLGVAQAARWSQGQNPKLVPPAPGTSWEGPVPIDLHWAPEGCCGW